MTPSELIAFENDIAKEFEAGHIKSPVHLAGGNENQLIDIFRDIDPDDWVLCSWRSHYHALLHGVPADVVRDAVLRGRSIALCFPSYRVLSSAIVGGICPIAVGLAWAIKKKKAKRRVHCFVGDMTSRTGLYHECWQYCMGHDLPVHWIIEDNHKSVCTNTAEVWGLPKGFPNVERYEYKMTKPHVGTGKFVRF
jgi:TPP-dependent pyruvate/acetoin dehydrogenase alpha subunit